MKRIRHLCLVAMITAGSCITLTEANAREFLHAFLHVNFGFTYSIVGANFLTYEKNANYSIFYQYLNRAGHYNISYNLFVDFMPIPPYIFANETQALKIGIRARYNNNYLKQTLTAQYTSSVSRDYGGNLMTYTSWMVGPVLYYSPFISSADMQEAYTASGGFTFFVLFGQIIKGRLRAYPSLREMESTLVPMLYSTNIRGHRIDVGVGGSISFCSLNLGMNLYYSTLVFKTTYLVYETLGRNLHTDEFCIEVYCGIPFEWSRFPLHF